MPDDILCAGVHVHEDKGVRYTYVIMYNFEDVRCVYEDKGMMYIHCMKMNEGVRYMYMLEFEMHA